MKDKLAIIVPYRDRQEHLDVFVPHMHEFLKDKGIDYTIFIAEQTDDRPFNYGKLCNVVTKEVGKEYTYFAFHDIDMLPISDDCDYSYPDSPTHLATNVEAHDNKLPYPQYFGGVILINREDFETANGYSNEYWGYGFEDLDLLYRLQRSGAYLEKFYDLNQTYSRLDEFDILPYRIENVEPTLKKKVNTIEYTKLDKNSYFKGRINNIMRGVIQNSFSISLWFNDTEVEFSKKILMVLEGMDTGLFLDNGYVISQIWDNNKKPYDVSIKYNKNKWNHVVFSYNSHENTLSISLNNNTNVIKIPTDFILHQEYAYMNISDDVSEVLIGSIIIFDSHLSSDVVSDLYFDGFKKIDLIKNKYGVATSNIFNFKSLYKNSLLLDGGYCINHLKLFGNTTPNNIEEDITPELYLPIRLDGEYKSLVHEHDADIIKKYYMHDPDIEENSDIFFYDVLTNKLDYKSIGLSTLTYTILDIQNRKDYELIRIVT